VVVERAERSSEKRLQGEGYGTGEEWRPSGMQSGCSYRGVRAEKGRQRCQGGKRKRARRQEGCSVYPPRRKV